MKLSWRRCCNAWVTRRDASRERHVLLFVVVVAVVVVVATVAAVIH